MVASLAVAAALLVGTANADHPGDRTGVGTETIGIGLHVPFTGSSPVHPAFEAGARLYWRYLHDDLGISIHGRSVTLEVRDDASTPTVAAAECNDMAANSLLLVGFTGHDQLNACAHVASQQGIPYLTPGSYEDGLSAQDTYFALSTTREAESRILAEYIANRIGMDADTYGRVPLVLPVLDLELPLLTTEGPDGEVKVALVRRDAPAADATEDELRVALEDEGDSLDQVYTFVKEGNLARAEELADVMRQDDIDVAVVDSGATFFAMLTNRSRVSGYDPVFVGYAMGGGWDEIAQIACGSGGIKPVTAFSAWPAWSDAGSFDADFVAAASAYESENDILGRGDFLFAGWGLMKSIHRVLEAAGPDPTREDLVAILSDGYAHTTGIFPDVSYDAADHFGADAVHRLEADCSAHSFRTKESFVTGYPAG